MLNNLELYETIGFIVPGTVVFYGISFFYPEINYLVNKNEFSIGDLGLFVILSYSFGHIIQGLGNFIEYFGWKIFGKPTDKLRTRGYLPNAQLLALKKDLPKKLRLGSLKEKDIASMSNNEWSNITRQVYASIAVAKCNKRVDMFNANYALYRGLTAGFFVTFNSKFVKS